MPRRPADDDDDAPRRRSRRHEDDEEDEEDRPRRKQGRAGKPNLTLWLGIGGGALLLLVLVGVIGVVALGRVRDAAQRQVERDRLVPGVPTPAQPPTPAVVAPTPVPVPGPAAPPLPGAVAHWTFDDAPGGRAADAVGKAGAATLVGGRLGPGVRGQAVHFDGTANQYADLGPAAALNFRAGADFSVAGWFQTWDSGGTVLSLRNSRTDKPQIDLAVRNASLLLVLGDDTDPGQGHASVWGGPVADGRWHHFAAVRTGGEAALYLDGRFQDRKGGTAVAGAITTDLRAVGSERLWASTNDARWGPFTFKGAVDDVWVFDRALTEGDLRRLME